MNQNHLKEYHQAGAGKVDMASPHNLKAWWPDPIGRCSAGRRKQD